MTLVLAGENRYDRQTRLTWWDQDRLSTARVLVAGAGALGNEIVKNLVLMGVGSILVVDFDVVEESNLARCVFFRPGDDGRPKIDALCERASDLNPDVRIEGRYTDVRSLGTGIAYRADVMVGALDNIEARLYLNRLAWRVGRPWVDGAMEGLLGIARVFTPPQSCFECTLTEGDYAVLAHRRSCRLLSVADMARGRVPTTATAASIIGGLQGQEVVKLLHAGRDSIIALDGAVVIDGTNNDAYAIRYPLDDDCLAHDTFGEPIRMKWSTTLTFAEIVASAGFDEATVELGDDHITTWFCPTCGEHAPAGTPASLVPVNAANCHHCGEARQFELATTIAVPSPRASLTIGQVGVRPDDVLAVTSTAERRFVWLQHAGDLPSGWA